MNLANGMVDQISVAGTVHEQRKNIVQRKMGTQGRSE